MPPEQLLLASLLQAFYGIRSVRFLLEQLHHLWPPAGFVNTKNRDRLLNVQVMGKFLEKLMGTPEVNPLLSNDTHRSRTDPADAVFSEGVSLLARTGAPIACPSSAAQRPIQ